MARLNRVKSFRGTTKTETGNLTCGRCGTEIKKGDAYQWWANKLPRSRFASRHNRCMSCTPRQSEMTPGRRGQLLAVEEALSDALDSAEQGTGSDEFEQAASDAADGLRDLAQELTEGADNIEDGFGHETYQSEELRERAEALEGVADELEGVAIDEAPEEPEADEEGEPEDRETAREEYESDLADWREAARSEIDDLFSQAEV